MNSHPHRSDSLGGTIFRVLMTGACYYFATQIAWTLCFPDSKVSLFFPPHAVLVSVLLCVPTRHWWAYTLAAAGSHFAATQHEHWPFFYALHCEAFDAAQHLLMAAGLRIFIKSPLKLITLRDAVSFVLIAVVIVPFGAAFWGAAFTVSNHFGTRYWVEWRNLGVSNAVTSIVLVPAILLGVNLLSSRRSVVKPTRWIEAALLGASLVTVGMFVFDDRPAGPDTSPALLYATIPLLIWAALRFGLGGTSAAMLVVTFQAIRGTMHGHGPFLMQSPPENAFALQIFLLFTATPLMLLATVIGEERRSQSELRISQERMTLAADAAQLGLWTWDMSDNSIWLTKKLRELLAYSDAEKVTYENLLMRVHEEERLSVAHAVQQAIVEGGRFHKEYRVVLPDGLLRWLSGRGRVNVDAAGRPVQMLGVVIDITERKRSEEALRESEERFRSVANTAPVMIWMAGTDMLYNFVNQGWLDFTGHAIERELGDGWAESIHAEDRDRCLNIYTNSFDARRKFSMEYRLQNRDGGYGWVLDTGVPRFASGGAFLGYIGSCVDITERKQTELEIARQRNELAHLSRLALLGELSGSLAHELNQPLAAILSNAQAAQRFLAHDNVDLDELREILGDIVDEDKRAGEVIRRLRLLLKKGEVQYQLFDLNEMVREVLKLVRSDLVNQSVIVRTELAPVLPTVNADRVQLQQVLLNLVMNACDAMAGGAADDHGLIIRTGLAGNGGVCVSVADRGTGLAPDTLEKVFEPFFTTKVLGMGLGLSVCRTIITAHGGKLWAANNPERGATFHFTLPASAEANS